MNPLLIDNPSCPRGISGVFAYVSECLARARFLTAVRRSHGEHPNAIGMEGYVAFQKATFLAPIQAEPPLFPNETHPADHPLLPVVVLKDADGRTVLPLFSDRISLNRWKPSGAKSIKVKGARLMKAALDTGITSIAINTAGGSPGIVIDVAELRTMPDKLLFDERDPKGAWRATVGTKSIFIDPPTDTLGDQLLGAIRLYCSRNVDIDSAFLVRMTLWGGRPHPAIGISFSRRVSRSQASEIVRRLVDEVRPCFREGEYADFISMKERRTIRDDILSMGSRIYFKSECNDHKQ